MPDLTAQRTLVKSPPELWSEVSEVESLAKHLGELGEIRITKVEPESTVAWEGELISGTVELEQSGWGTKVTFHVTVPEPEPAVAEAEPEASSEPEPEPEPEPAVIEAEPEPELEAVTEVKSGFWARLFRKRTVTPAAVAAEPEPEPVAAESGPEPVVAEPEPVVAELTPEAEPEPDEVARVQGILDGTLDSLGQAHHRPFSRG